MLVLISGVAFGGTMQYFNPRPRRFLVPGGGCLELWHRLWTARFIGWRDGKFPFLFD